MAADMSDRISRVLVKLAAFSFLLAVGGADAENPGLDVYLYINDTQVDFLDVIEEEKLIVTFVLQPLSEGDEVEGELIIKEVSPDSFGHVTISPESFSVTQLEAQGELSDTFNVTGSFVGFSKLQFLLVSLNGEVQQLGSETLIVVQRSNKLLDEIFTMVLVILLSLTFVNMGCKIELEVIFNTLKRPVGPVIALASQYFLMPLTSYGLGYLLLKERPGLWLGLFITGCSPGGGGSNIWTHLLGGSLDLSITMSFVSSVVAFAAMPLWVFALGSHIFKDGTFEIPYANVALVVVSLVIPCAIGVAFRRFVPKVADMLQKLLTPVALIFLIVCTFGIYVNFYVFYYFTWQIVLLGLAVPGLGFFFGVVLATLCKRRIEEVIAISVETAIQNNVLALGVIKLALKEFAPLGDIAVIVTITVAVLTPIPLVVALFVKFVYTRHRRFKLNGIDGPFEGAAGAASASSLSLRMTSATSQTPLNKDLK